MKFSVEGFQQAELMKLKTTTKKGVVQTLDAADAIILRWIIDFFNTEKMIHRVINNRIYFWILYEYVINDLPILGIQETKAISRRFKKYVDMNILFSFVSKGREAYIQNGELLHRYGTFTYFCFNAEILTKLLKGGEYKEKEYLEKYKKATRDSKVLSTDVQRTQKFSVLGLESPQYSTGLKSPAKDHSIINPSTNYHEVFFNDLKYIIQEDGWIKHDWNGNLYQIHNEPNEDVKLYALQQFKNGGCFEGKLNL